MRKFYVLISLLVMGLFLTGCDSIESYKGTIEQVIQHKVESQDDKETSENVEFVEVTVSRVIDGDTFEIEGQHKVRLIGINTPESTNKQELYGKEASAFTKSQLEGFQSTHPSRVRQRFFNKSIKFLIKNRYFLYINQYHRPIFIHFSIDFK